MASKVLGAIGSPKARPFLIGGVVLIGGLVIFMMMRGGGGSQTVQAGASGPSEALQAAQLQATTQLAIAQLGANQQATQTAAELQAFMYGKDADTELALLQTDRAAAIQLAGVAAQQAIAMEGQYTQQYGLEVQKQIALSNNQTEVEREKIRAGVANTQTKAASKASTLSTLGSIATAAFAIFSDQRTKRNISWVGIRTYDGLGKSQPIELSTYEFEYIGQGSKKHRGMIAQDIAKVFPSHVMPTNHGNRWLAVDYDAM